MGEGIGIDTKNGVDRRGNLYVTPIGVILNTFSITPNKCWTMKAM